MKNLKIGNIKENEEFTLKKEYPKWISQGCVLGLINGAVITAKNVIDNPTMPIKNLFVNFSACVGCGALVAIAIYPMFHLWMKKSIQNKEQDTKALVK